MTDKQYDIILFGVTGFTGKLAAEYLFKREDDYKIKWAASARNATKAETILKDLSLRFGGGREEVPPPPVLEADLVCETSEQEDILRDIVRQTKVVLTCSGPFEKYSQTLVKLCAELGVYYADITGESDFFRQTIEKHDKTAQESGAVIICHSGTDCIPCDLTVYEMHKFAKEKGYKLKEVMTYEELGESAALSGGTAKTATFQLSKDRTKAKTTIFDPLLTTVEGNKSEFATKNISPKKDIAIPEMKGRKAGPWVMSSVMVNCVRRSNALLGYSKDLKYGDAIVKHDSYAGWFKDMSSFGLLSAAVAVPSVFERFLPQPGEGPDRADMEKGFLKLYAWGTMVKEEEEDSDSELKLAAKFQFNKDTGYLYTAVMLVETGMVLLEKYGTLDGGCKTPASALGSDLTQRILKEMDTSFEVKEVTDNAIFNEM